MGLFGLKWISQRSLDRMLGEAHRAGEARFSPHLKKANKTIADRDETIATLQKKVEVFEKVEAARPQLAALIEKGKKDRWRFKIMSGDDIIAMPPIRGYGGKAEAEDMVQLLSDARINVTVTDKE